MNKVMCNSHCDVQMVAFLVFQVTIEVIDNPQADMEMDLDEESHRDWGASSVDLPGNKKLFWPLFWGYPDSEEEDSSRPGLGETAEEDSSEELVLSGVGDDWDGRWRKGWDTKETYGEPAALH